MSWFLCVGCMSLLRKKGGHLCRIPYPRTGPEALGVAKVGVASLRCVGKLWFRERT